MTLAGELKRRGHNVQFFTYYPQDHFREFLDDLGIPVVVYAKSARFSLKPLLVLRRLITTRAFDAVVSFLDTPNMYAELACLGLPNTKLVVSERSMYPHGRMRVARRVLQEFHRVADFITVNSHHQRIRMLAEFPWMLRKIQTIYNGYELKPMYGGLSGSTGGSQPQLLAISSVAFNKNSISLARALKICRDVHNLIVKVDWVGTQSVSGEGTRPMEETDEFLRKEGLSSQWHWLGVRRDIEGLLLSHDALIHPSLYEGLPNVICEALACGRPVLAGNVCDHSLLVADQVSGYLFDPMSPVDMASAIVSFSRRTESERVAMGAAARRFADENLSVGRYADDYERLLVDLLKSY